MTAPEPTAVERTIAEVLRQHRPVRGRSQFEADRCATCDVPVMFMHRAQGAQGPAAGEARQALVAAVWWWLR